MSGSVDDDSIMWYKTQSIETSCQYISSQLLIVQTWTNRDIPLEGNRDESAFFLIYVFTTIAEKMTND